MTDPTARAITSVAIAGACCVIALAEPAYGVLCVIGMVAGIYLVWDGV